MAEAEKGTNIFDEMAEEYDAWYDSEAGRPLYENELKCLEPLVGGGPVLEIGAGTGRFAVRFPRSIGVDTAHNALRMAGRRGVAAVRAAGEELPFRDRVFGTVLMVVTLCFVKDPVKVLREAGRVLMPDGSLIVCFIPKDSPWGALYEEKKRKGHPFYAGATMRTVEEVEELIEKAGLRVLRTRSALLSGPPGPLTGEEPAEGYEKGAGFVCLKTVRRG